MSEVVDVPIIGVGPILSGGVDYQGPQLGTQGNDPTDPGYGSEWTNYAWFDPLEIYCSDPSISIQNCSFFCNTCAGVLLPTLVNLDELQGTAPVYPNWTPANISALGVCQIFEQWLYSTFWQKATGGTETAPGPPGEPGSPTPIYG